MILAGLCRFNQNSNYIPWWMDPLSARYFIYLAQRSDFPRHLGSNRERYILNKLIVNILINELY